MRLRLLAGTACEALVDVDRDQLSSRAPRNRRAPAGAAGGEPLRRDGRPQEQLAPRRRPTHWKRPGWPPFQNSTAHVRAVLVHHQLDQRRGVEVEDQRRCSRTRSETEPEALMRGAWGVRGLGRPIDQPPPFELGQRLLALLDTDQTRDRFPAPGDDDRLAVLNPPKVLAELVVKLADPDLASRSNVASLDERSSYIRATRNTLAAGWPVYDLNGKVALRHRRRAGDRLRDRPAAPHARRLGGGRRPRRRSRRARRPSGSASGRSGSAPTSPTRGR